MRKHIPGIGAQTAWYLRCRFEQQRDDTRAAHGADERGF